VSEGFVSALMLVRVGANAQVEGNKLIVKIGYSNPKEYMIPEGIAIKTPSATEILVEGIDIQRVSQVAAEIIRIRPPEPYKGTGILKKGQKIALKAAKKK
jgi:large subunit ribosomal protein L6